MNIIVIVIAVNFCLEQREIIALKEIKFENFRRTTKKKAGI